MVWHHYQVPFSFCFELPCTWREREREPEVAREASTRSFCLPLSVLPPYSEVHSSIIMPCTLFDPKCRCLNTVSIANWLIVGGSALVYESTLPCAVPVSRTPLHCYHFEGMLGYKLLHRRPFSNASFAANMMAVLSPFLRSFSILQHRHPSISPTEPRAQCYVSLMRF